MTLKFRAATAADLGFIIRLLVDDSVTPHGDDPNHPEDPRYLAALAAIDADPNQMLRIAEAAGERVGTLQLTFIPGIGRHGSWRCLVEQVHVIPAARNRGYGGQMMRWAIDTARARGCGLVQLTSNKQRRDAHRFYERLGFARSHEGFKYYLDS